MDLLQHIRQPIASKLAQYDALFDQVLTHNEGFMDQVLTYVRRRKGKMMRPILVLLLAKEWGEIRASTLHSAVTLELLHTSSLIHDDVVDESEERRGQTSVHSLYGNKIAVLMGDYMLSKTLEQSALTGNVEVVKVVADLGATLSEGEIHQLSFVQDEDISEETYYAIIRRKTASLFAACGKLAAISVGAEEAFTTKATKFGELVGMCFQIRDDIFDYYDDPAIGKPRGNDMAEGKLTLPLILALKHTGSEEMYALARKVKAGKATAEEMARLMDFTKQNGGVAGAEAKMNELRNEAVELIADFKDEAVKAALEMYIDFVIGRKM